MERRDFIKRTALAGAGLPLLLAAPSQRSTRAFAQTTPKKNVLLILTDDQDAESCLRMPALRSRLGAGGTQYRNGMVGVPVCGPSRASLFTGRYPHNHGCLENSSPISTYEAFRGQNSFGKNWETDCLPVWLQRSGVTTALFGKYINGYGGQGGPEPNRQVPPGWNNWLGWQGGYNQHGGYYKVTNEKSNLVTVNRREQHDTDWFAGKADAFIRNHRADEAPWFLTLSLNAPHSPSFSAPRHDGMFANVQMPRPPSFNEFKVGPDDKPAWVRERDRLDGPGVRDAVVLWRQRMRALQSVDNLVGRLIATLAATGQANDTMVVFTSDNGYLLHRHRVYSKDAPYRESVNVPFYVRGPGVEQGLVSDDLVTNIDLAPTILEWTGSPVPEGLDGRSFAGAPIGRKKVYSEYTQASHPWQAVLTAEGETYVENRNGEIEYYDRRLDPYELDSAHEEPENDGRISELAATLDGMSQASGEEYRVLEG